MKDDAARPELMAIPIVAVLFGIGLVLLIASVKGVWAWLFVGAAGLVLAAGVERGVIGTATTRYSVPVTHRELSSSS